MTCSARLRLSCGSSTPFGRGVIEARSAFVLEDAVVFLEGYEVVVAVFGVSFVEGWAAVAVACFSVCFEVAFWVAFGFVEASAIGFSVTAG